MIGYNDKNSLDTAYGEQVGKDLRELLRALTDEPQARDESGDRVFDALDELRHALSALHSARINASINTDFPGINDTMLAIAEIGLQDFKRDYGEG